MSIVEDYKKEIIDTRKFAGRLYESRYSEIFEKLDHIGEEYNEIAAVFGAVDEICKKYDEMGFNSSRGTVYQDLYNTRVI
ncbi:hypothetical protein KAS08_01260 [Candidatus Pacearchaeota archaeon]|nr:hypothetical protein [Candidatus Pacearchaeota archaeon]